MTKANVSPDDLAQMLDKVLPKPLDQEIDRAIAEHSNSIVVDLDNGIILRAKRPAESLFGYDPGELQGKSIHDLVPTRFREVHRHWIDQYKANPASRAMGSRGMELRGIDKQGREFPVEIGLAAVDLGELRLAIATVIPMVTRSHPRAEE